jgi:hypothetical protein
MSLAVIRTPLPNEERFLKIFNEEVYALKGAYRMRDQEI